MAEWSGEIIDQLVILWDDGHTTAEIGRRLGVTKNAVVGKVRRLDLPPRPSPIIRDGEKAPARPRRQKMKTLPELVSLAPRLDLKQIASLGRRPPEPPRVVSLPIPASPPPSRCQYPLWGALHVDGRPVLAQMRRDPHPGLSPRFCDAPVASNGERWLPFCCTHAAICYQPRRAVPEMVAA